MIHRSTTLEAVVNWLLLSLTVGTHFYQNESLLVNGFSSQIFLIVLDFSLCQRCRMETCYVDYVLKLNGFYPHRCPSDDLSSKSGCLLCELQQTRDDPK